MEEYYNSDEDFKRYVDSYCGCRCIPIEVAFTHDIVRQVYLYYRNKQ